VGRRRHADDGRKMARLIALLIAVMLNCAVAHADINVDVPGPGACPYPGVSDQGMVGVMVATFWWSCDFPIEENGSNWHCYYYGAAGQGNVGFSMMLQAGMAGPVGGMKGGCHYVCPSGPDKGKRTAIPNPPSAWKYALVPKPCVPLKDQPPSEEMMMNSPPPEEPPDFAVGPPPPSGATPAVTNPDQGNPAATVNPPTSP
jgi:hypothetical protein